MLTDTIQHVDYRQCLLSLHAGARQCMHQTTGTGGAIRRFVDIGMSELCYQEMLEPC